MGSSSSTVSRDISFIRFVPRESTHEKLYVVEEEDDYPTAKPPGVPLKDIYDPNQNLVIYDHAISTPKEMEKSWSDLVHYLTSIYRTDMMKVRSVFTWLGVQDIESENIRTAFNDVTDDSPRGYKKLIKERNGSYAAMFAILCRKAGLKCVIINGISKGSGYQVSDTKVEHLRDRWNAVYLDGWRLIHPLWAYKSRTSYKRGKWSLPDSIEDMALKVGETPHDFNEKYFLVDPSHLVHLCFPDKAKWQLCSTKMSLEKWTESPHLQVRYFKDGYKLEDYCYKSKLEAVDSLSSVMMKAPDQKADFQLACFFYINQVLSKPKVSEPVHLKNFVLMSRDVRDKRWTFEVRIPVQGVYKLTVFGGPCRYPKLAWICDIGIFSDSDPEDIRPYPDCPEIGFGPVAVTEQAGLVEPSHPTGMVFINPRFEYHITFKIQKSLDVYAELVSPRFSKKTLKNWFTCVMNNPSNVHVLDVMVKVMENGEFALKIFAKSKESKLDYRNVCNYYLSTDPPREYGKQTFKKRHYKTATEILARKGMSDAEKGKDIDILKKAVEKFEKRGYRDQDGTHRKATKKLAFLELSKNLRDAINRRNLEVLDKAITDAEDSDHAGLLTKLLAKAREERDFLASHSDSNNKFTHEILAMKQSTISELTTYNKPPPMINDVLVAFLLLLGDREEDLRIWDDVKISMRKTGQDSIMRRVRRFDGVVAVASQAKVTNIITKYDEESVKAASVGAATFYRWTKNVLEEAEKQTEKTNDEGK